MKSFTPAITAASWTFSSVPSILTELYPHNHGAAYSDDSSRNQDLINPPNGIHDDAYTIAELLDASGNQTKFITAIKTAAIPLKGRFKSTKRRHDVNAETLLSEIQEWWNSEPNPKFGYVQLGDLHEYLHEPENAYFGDIPNVEGINRWRFTSGDIQTAEFEEYCFTRGLLYDTLIRYIDEQIDRTLNILENFDNTIVIVTGDHGEELWEYKDFEETYFKNSRGINGVGHGHALVPPVLETPIATNIEGLPTSESHQSLTDIVPTILYELSVDPDIDFDGQPLQNSSHTDKSILSEEIAYGPN